MDQNDTDISFMRQALDLARQALDAGEFPVGCVIAAPWGVIATGGRTCSRLAIPSEIDHAEINALKNFYANSYIGNRQELSLYTTLEPCLMCFAATIIAGMGRIVYAYEDVMGGGTCCRLNELAPVYRNARIRIVPQLLREQSRDLFYRYFSNPENTYLQNTMIAEHALKRK